MVCLRFAKYPDFCPALYSFLLSLRWIRERSAELSDATPDDLELRMGLVSIRSIRTKKLLAAWGTSDSLFTPPVPKQAIMDLSQFLNECVGPKNNEETAKELAQFLFTLQDGLPSLPITEEEYNRLCGKKMKQNLQKLRAEQSLLRLNENEVDADTPSLRCLLALQYYECLPPLFLCGQGRSDCDFKEWDAKPAEHLAKLRREIEEKKPR